MAYFTKSLVPAFGRARSDGINSNLTNIESGFNKLPSETNLKQGLVNYAVGTGAADAYVVALPHAPASYVDGLEVVFKASATNTGASTINVNSLGLKSIKRQDGSALAAGDIQANKISTLRYNSTSGQFEIQSSLSGIVASASASATSAAASAAAAAASYDSFDDRYLGAKASEPTTDNDGNPLLEGAFYWNTTSKKMRIYDGSLFTDFDIRAVYVNNANGNPNISDTSFYFSSLTNNSWESVGPTGSGAIHIWTALDSVPAYADWVRLKYYGGITATSLTSGTSIKLSLNSRIGSEPLDTEVLIITAIGDAAGFAYTASVDEITVQIGTGGIFYLKKNLSGAATDLTSELKLIGYGSN